MAQFIPHGAISASEIGFDLFIFMANDEHNQPPQLAGRKPNRLIAGYPCCLSNRREGAGAKIKARIIARLVDAGVKRYCLGI